MVFGSSLDSFNFSPAQGFGLLFSSVIATVCLLGFLPLQDRQKPGCFLSEFVLFHQHRSKHTSTFIFLFKRFFAVSDCGERGLSTTQNNRKTTRNIIFKNSKSLVLVILGQICGIKGEQCSECHDACGSELKQPQ